MCCVGPVQLVSLSAPSNSSHKANMISSLSAVITVLLVCVKMSSSTFTSAEVINHEYCVVGAGPGGTFL